VVSLWSQARFASGLTLPVRTNLKIAMVSSITAILRRMPRLTPSAVMDDPLLLAFDKLPEHQLLTASQVATVLQVSGRWLEERRAKGEPPPWMEVGKRMVRYAAGPLRSWLRGQLQTAPASSHEASQRRAADIAGLDEPILRGGRRKKPQQSSFNAFLAHALPDHEWPFALVGSHQRPVDFIEALTMELDDEVSCVWLTLGDYLTKLRDAAQGEEADALADDLDGVFPQAKGSTRPRDRL